jgi:hypothetical protein
MVGWQHHVTPPPPQEDPIMDATTDQDGKPIGCADADTTTVTVSEGFSYRITGAQRHALVAICDRFKVRYRPEDYRPTFDLPKGWVAGWVGGTDGPGSRAQTIYVGCDPEGRLSS